MVADAARNVISGGVNSATGGMSQTGIIFAAVAVAFFVYITTKGELPAYIAVFIGKAKTASTAPSSLGATSPVQSVTPVPTPGTFTPLAPSSASTSDVNTPFGVWHLPSWAGALP